MAFVDSQKNNPPTIVGTGLIALDVVIHSDAPSCMHVLTGGTCGNVLSIMSYLGWGSYPVARLNGDGASQQVQHDLSRWGVHLDFANLSPHGNTPIIVQKVKNRVSGDSRHTFSWNCPSCGADFPRFKPIVTSSAKNVVGEIERPSVFFTDRCTPASLLLAKACAEKGALVVFEPSAIGDMRLFEEMVTVSHILKYSEDRLGHISDLDFRNSPYLQIETCGNRGLRYRIKPNRSDWLHLDSLPVAYVRDTCGAGDWMTAGLIHKIGAHGATGLLESTPEEIVEALELGQAMAGWNCHFIGARGGMYECDNLSMRQQVDQIINGCLDFVPAPESKIPSASSMAGLCSNCGTSSSTPIDCQAA